MLVILRHERRRLLSLSVSANPTAEWIARQVTNAFPWDEAPDYLIRDRDAAYGQAVTKRLTAMGIRDHPTATRSPWQNGHAESAGSASITSSSSAGAICAGSLWPTPAITTNAERTCPWKGFAEPSADPRRTASSILSDLVSGRHSALRRLSYCRHLHVQRPFPFFGGQTWLAL